MLLSMALRIFYAFCAGHGIAFSFHALECRGDVCSLPVTLKHGAGNTCLQGKSFTRCVPKFCTTNCATLPYHIFDISIIFVHMPLQIEMTRPPHIRQTFATIMATARNCCRMARHCISFCGSPPPVGDNAIRPCYQHWP